MDHAAFPVVVGGVAAVVATTFSLLPEHLDVTHVFAAYGTGTIVGEFVGARSGLLEPAVYMRRFGGLAMAIVAALWVVGLVGGTL